MTPMVPPGTPPDRKLFEFYEEEAQKYYDSLPLEHFMEATDHAHQRKITLESFDVIREGRPDVQCFNELLVQYPRGDGEPLGRVVPDNFVVIHPTPLAGLTNFATPLQPADIFLVFEYVSKAHVQKDYEDNFRRYEEDLRVPYYLLSYRDNQELSLFKRGKKKYKSVKPNDARRLAIPELEIEAAILDGWVRFWFRGALVPLPGDLLRERNAAQRRATEAEAEVARLREELARLKGAS
ncbi:MAG TPA: Uma2 family endonuclease [Gemmataceae bacterium]|nr:Uma2 family endonuclease [Gemmataceae bacterium]